MIDKKDLGEKESYKFVRNLFEGFLYRLIIVIIDYLSRLLIKADLSRGYLNALK